MKNKYEKKKDLDGSWVIYRMLQPEENRYYSSSEYILEDGEFWLPILRKNDEKEIEKELEKLKKSSY